MRLIGWGALWGFGLFTAPFLGISAIGLIFNPTSVGYLLFAVPVVAISGATAGALGGALTAAIAPLARTGQSTGTALARCVVVYFLSLTIAVTVPFLLFVPEELMLGLALLIPVVVLIATGLATWGFALDRRRAIRAGTVWTPGPSSRW
ncbi:hypothetical protein [Cellulomonas endometrii]|uniref:hypothetical protein n=1 Tax=Cellulomonas endometrii TaxID=3036301 RepID=UPI0024ACB78C|nr:hypothetical protein [Cellulomonas endometrii]